MLDTRSAAAEALGGRTYAMLIDGDWSAGSATFSVTNPATGDHLADVPDGTEDDSRAAITAAGRALPAWAARPAGERAVILREIARRMVADADRLATIMTLEQGKPLAEAKGEIVYAASFLAWFAGEAERVYGQVVPASAANKRILVLRQPAGVVAMITPWNFPAAMLTRKLGPALAAGCTVVCKPAEQTPLTAIELGRICQEAGLPAGVLNIVTTIDPRRFADPVMADDRVRVVSFTGSTEVGKLLIAQSAPTVKRLALELGGNAPFLVFDDADLDAAVDGAIASKFRNSGQTCVCANRIFVQRGIHDRFLDAFTAKVQALRVGNGLDPATTIGPLIDEAAREKVRRHVRDAVGAGARIVAGGDAAPLAGGAYWTPTVIDDVNPSMLVAREETFGPVAPILPFDDDDAVIDAANDTPFGLAAYFFTRDASRLFRVAERLQYGIVGANDALPSTAQAPFGGVKQSGIGREGGSFGIDEYVDVKYVSIGL